MEFLYISVHRTRYLNPSEIDDSIVAIFQNSLPDSMKKRVSCIRVIQNQEPSLTTWLINDALVSIL